MPWYEFAEVDHSTPIAELRKAYRQMTTKPDVVGYRLALEESRLREASPESAKELNGV